LMWSWWWWIDLARWHTSFPPRKMPQPKKREGCSSCACLNNITFPRTLCRLKISSSQASFGKPCGSTWGRSSKWAPHSNPKWMDKSKEWTWLFNNS
jgi:hypothetical protein